MRWEVFRQEEEGGYHTHCGDVHAPDAEMAKLFAQIQHGRRKPTHGIWVAPADEVYSVDADETVFGGSTDKSYRWATAYNVDASHAQEVADSEAEQREAEGRRGGS